MQLKLTLYEKYNKIAPTWNNFYQNIDGVWIHKDVPKNLKSHALVAYKNSLLLTKVQKEIVIGTLLGDATIGFPGIKTSPSCHIVFCQKQDAADYVEHLYQIFKPFVGTPPRVNKIGGIKPGKPLRYEVRFRSYSHDCFNYYYEAFYPVSDNKRKRPKRVPENISELLTPRGLAYWFMDDGSRGTQIMKPRYFLSTHGFSYNDQLILVKVLETKFEIQSVLHKDKTYFRLSIKKESIKTFFDLISPYMHPYFYYKL